ncbi:ATP-binding cassette domain-containing protein [Nocardioides sp.]|jgi:ABC-2 type transport system ATP-binding protein|uniref:ATP-binding cassette domain-containing protein n=1 Tax=Nocardioides sp. TaxID=35761 RepID=UPI0026094B83|nr:ATP-binding cassette domain-containing protein [Nocardioides sp.]
MIDVRELTRSYGAHRAVDGISFTTRPGRVTGFLGPNGAGKSTAMRMIIGLTAPTSGTATIGGVAYQDIVNPGRHVGVLLDAGAQHDGRTGREILTIGAQTMRLPRSRVDEMLATVSLSDEEAHRRFRDYSLGMKQRLGIAHALLGDPAVLILDEPANGLDPAGIRWMRDLLKGYARRGGTVLLSSHLLHEVELVADDLVLIGRGRIVAQGDLASLGSGDGRGAALVTAQDNDALAAALAREGLRSEPEGTGLRVHAGTADVGRVAAEHRLVLTDLRSGAQGLEDLFLELTASTQREAPSTTDGHATTSTTKGAPR